MKQLVRLALAVMLACGVMAGSAQPAEAADAKDTKLTVKVNIAYDWIFWDLNFMTKDNYIGKPAVVKVGYFTAGGATGDMTYVPAVTPGKKTGEVTIYTEKGGLVNLEVIVCDAKNNRLGFYNMVLRNKGQTETVTVGIPETVEPQFVWGG